MRAKGGKKNKKMAKCNQLMKNNAIYCTGKRKKKFKAAAWARKIHFVVEKQLLFKEHH